MVGSLNPAKCLVQFEPETYWFWLQRLNLLGHSLHYPGLAQSRMMFGGIIVWGLCNKVVGLLVSQQKVPKTFPGPDNLHFKNGVVWLWHLLINLHGYIYEIYQQWSYTKNEPFILNMRVEIVKSYFM